MVVVIATSSLKFLDRLFEVRKKKNAAKRAEGLILAVD